MIITDDVRWINDYEQLNEYDIQLTIISIKNGKPYNTTRYIIPIELYSEVKNWNWQIYTGFCRTPTMANKQFHEMKKLTGKKRGIKPISLNNITPFMMLCKNGKTMVSNKNNYSCEDNDRNGVLWYEPNERERAYKCYDTYVQKTLDKG